MTAVPPPDELHASDSSWRLWALAGGAIVVGLTLGLVVMPERTGNNFEAFISICRALGIPGYEKIPADPGAAKASPPVSDVAWTVATDRLLSDASPTRGAVLAKSTCGACHGVDGKSVAPSQFPNLAGQSQAAIFKELSDFKSGDRKSEFMQPVAQPLTKQQMADVAAYYAARPLADVKLDDAGMPHSISTLAITGDPLLAIPPCGACHDRYHGGPVGTPFLYGQSASYLEKQLKDFASDKRHNDLFERMRTIARKLTPEEVHDLAVYYQGTPAR